MLFMSILYRSSNGGQGSILGRGPFQSRGYGVEEQLFARCPLGKIWAGSAALENATGVEGCGKGFQKAVTELPAIFQKFPYMEKLDFRVCFL
jgi:hypothetical protein